MSDIIFEPMHVAGRRLRRKEVSSVELTQAVLQQVERWGERINPFVTLTADLALDMARERDAEREDGIDRGPLHGIPVVLRAMRKRGVEHVLWLTLRATSKQYADIDHAIYAAGQKWRPLLTVLDWNHYSNPHHSWYASDGIHLSGTGAIAFATYVHRSLKRLGLTGPLPAIS